MTHQKTKVHDGNESQASFEAKVCEKLQQAVRTALMSVLEAEVDAVIISSLLTLYFLLNQRLFKQKSARKSTSVKHRRMAMGIGVIIIFFFVVLAITSLIALLTKDRKYHSNQATRRFFIPPPLMGTTNPRKSGYWYTTNWFAREKVEEAILEGQERNTHERRSRHAHSQQKRSRHGH